MKTRLGFVSNSSSSSFLLIDGKSESSENVENNKKLIIEQWDEDYWEEHFPDEFKNRKILDVVAIEYGCGSDVDSILNIINKHSNTNFELIDLENY